MSLKSLNVGILRPKLCIFARKTSGKRKIFRQAIFWRGRGRVRQPPLLFSPPRRHQCACIQVFSKTVQCNSGILPQSKWWNLLTYLRTKLICNSCKTHRRATERHLPYRITVLPATRHGWTRPALTPARQASTRFTYPGGTEDWVDLGVGYTLRWFTCPQTVTHPSSNHLVATRPGVKPTTSWSWVRHSTVSHQAT